MLQLGGKTKSAAAQATVVRHFVDTYGIRFKTVAAFNEPSGPWWSANCCE